MPDIEATPGADDANSYVEQDAMVDYADARVGGSAWTGLSAADQARSLISATYAIDSLDLLGDPTDPEQALHFPVDGSDVIPRRIEQATMELALSYAPALAAFAAGSTGVVDPVSPAPSNIKREQVGPLETEYFTPTAASAESVGLLSFPVSVQRLLERFVRSATTAAWGSATVVRSS